MDASVKKKISVICWIIGFFIIWQILAFVMAEVVKDPRALQKWPYVTQVFAALWQNRVELLGACWLTLRKAFVGFVVGGVIGFVLAVIMSLSRNIEKGLYPIIITTQMIPVLGLSPIVFSICHDGDLARVIMAAYTTFFTVTINTLDGFNSVEPSQKDLMKMLAASKPVVYLKLMIPSALQGLLTGLKISAPKCITAAILVEMLGTNEGIGAKIVGSLYNGINTALLFWSSVMSAAFLGICFYAAVVFVGKLITPWQKEG